MAFNLTIAVAVFASMQGPAVTSAPATPTFVHQPPVADAVSAPAPTPLASELVASGFSNPVHLTAPKGDYSRLFIVEQYAGQIQILKNGAKLTTPFVTVTGVQVSSEQGLLGLAFHPNYQSNGYFYVNYTSSPNGDTVIARYKVSAGNPDVADPASKTVILTLPQPFANHNGGSLAFGPDGYLYIGLGDGGSGNDPLGNAQNLGSLLGKMLRIDVDHPQAPKNYGIPPTNPFVNVLGARAEIWAYGLRNPWRFSFDRLTNDLWIADVGQSASEEVNIQLASSTGGENYGWVDFEGTVPTGLGSGSGSFVAPIYEYLHWMLPGCAIIGGNVYRGVAIPDLRGTYFFADWCKSRIYSFEYVNGAVTNFINRTDELASPDDSYFIGPISAFGEDADGEIYILDYLGGEIFRIIPKTGGLTGIETFGTGTPGCSGVVELTATSSPVIGNEKFKIRVSNGPASSLGLMLFTDAKHDIPTDPFGISVATYLDFFNSSEIFEADMVSNAAGAGVSPLPIPSNPIIAGNTYTVQVFWHWPNGNCQTPSGTFSSSVGMSITILP